MSTGGSDGYYLQLYVPSSPAQYLTPTGRLDKAAVVCSVERVTTEKTLLTDDKLVFCLLEHRTPESPVLSQIIMHHLRGWRAGVAYGGYHRLKGRQFRMAAKKRAHPLPKDTNPTW